jgi:hypothetical protein
MLTMKIMCYSGTDTLYIHHSKYFTAGERSDSGIDHCLRPRPHRGSREPM